MKMIGKVRMGLAALALMALPAVAEEKREFKWSFNGAVTSDYVFRGFSQTAERWTGQAGIDLSYGIAYFGIWGSGLDFGLDGNRHIARAEIDFYAGIKPIWHGITFDLGVIYYAYPNARDNATVITGELDYVELKFGMSREIWKDGTLPSTCVNAVSDVNTRPVSLV
jgi:uncharacterized protein (TIGR02001 family)